MAEPWITVVAKGAMPVLPSSTSSALRLPGDDASVTCTVWKGVPLGEDEHGTHWWCTIRVERSMLFRKGFYVVDVYLVA
jgi:hypothetical protein